MDIKLMLQNQLVMMETMTGLSPRVDLQLDKQIALTRKRLETWDQDPEGLRFFGEIPL